ELQTTIAEFKKEADEHFKNYNPPTDQKVFAALLKMYHDDITPSLHPAVFGTVEKKFKGDFSKFAESVFKTSVFASKEKTDAFIKTPSLKIIEKDPAFTTMSSIIGEFRTNLVPSLRKVYGQLETANQLYLEGILQKKSDQNLYPDANFTMRLTYGT